MLGLLKRRWPWIAGLVVLAFVATFVVVRLAGTTEVTTTNEDTGLTASAKLEGSGAQITTEKVDDPPAYPQYHTMVGDITKVEVVDGHLADDGVATLTFPYPSGISPDELWIMRYDGESWQPLPPLGVDEDAHTVTFMTSEFSFWGLSKWEWQEKADDWMHSIENAFSSDGLFSGFGKLVANPPTEDCDYQALPLQVDVSDFVEGVETCVKFDTDDPERQTYKLYISNYKAFPVLVHLPEGVTFVESRPAPANPYSRLIQYAQWAMDNERTVSLPGGGMLVLEVNGLELPQDSSPVEITGELDFVTPVLDLGTAALSIALPFEPSDAVIDKIGKTQEVIDLAECSLAEGRRLSEVPLTDLTAELEISLATCAMTVDAIARRVVEVVVNDILKKGLTAEQLAKLFPYFRAATAVWENAHVFTQVASFMEEALSEGRKTYTLGLTLTDPPLERMWEVLPSPDTRMYLSDPELDEYFAWGGGIYTPSVVGYEVASCLPQQWDRGWLNDAYLGAELYNMSVDSDIDEDGVDDTISVDGFVLYVLPEHREDVSSYFNNMLGVEHCQTEPSSTNLDEWGTDMQQVTVSDWPNQTVAFTGDLLPYASEPVPMTNIMAYDPRGYILILNSSPGARLADPYSTYGMPTDAIMDALVPAADYLFERSDGMLGTTLS